MVRTSPSETIYAGESLSWCVFVESFPLWERTRHLLPPAGQFLYTSLYTLTPPADSCQQYLTTLPHPVTTLHTLPLLPNLILSAASSFFSILTSRLSTLARLYSTIPPTRLIYFICIYYISLKLYYPSILYHHIILYDTIFYYSSLLLLVLSLQLLFI